MSKVLYDIWPREAKYYGIQEFNYDDLKNDDIIVSIRWDEIRALYETCLLKVIIDETTLEQRFEYITKIIRFA